MTEFKSRVRAAVRRILPPALLRVRHRWLLRRSIELVDGELVGRPVAEIFSEIYRRRLWGEPSSDRKFSSGHGSVLEKHVAPYVSAVGEFVKKLPTKPSVVDLGCGDFNVGSRIRSFFGTYIACDIAPEVLEENKIRYSHLRVEFRQLDMIRDEFPEAEVCIIRQVLQHLSNADISHVVRKLNQFQILILTEPMPTSEFSPNIDQPTGVSSRLARGIPSGVVITEPPFCLIVKSSEIICTTIDDFSDARLVTTAYRLN